MLFGVVVHSQGPSPFQEIATLLSNQVKEKVANASLAQIDAVVLGFQSSSSVETGFDRLKRNVRRNYRVPSIFGGHHFYSCLVEIDALVADAEIIDATSVSESALFEHTRHLVLAALVPAFKGFPQEELSWLQGVVVATQLPHTARW